jgi:hypothetical protein
MSTKTSGKLTGKVALVSGLLQGGLQGFFYQNQMDAGAFLHRMR